MGVLIPDQYKDLCSKKSFAHLATLMPNGQPQVTPVWFDMEGSYVRFNSALGRQKDKNVRRDPRVSMSISDPDNPYRFIELRGRVVTITQDGADAHIDSLAKKYLGVDKYPYRQNGEVRVTYKVEIDRVNSMG